jgi:type II secretory pathway component PulF
MVFKLPAIFYHLNIQDKIDFARHLAMVVKAGLPIYEGLLIIKSQAVSKSMQIIIDQAITDVNSGRFLADSLVRYERLFGPFFINIVRVGEVSGSLAQNLLYLSEELKKSKAIQSKVKSAMIYPMVILFATLGVTGFLTFFVFPKILPVLIGLNVTLPPTTIAVIATVSFLQKYGLYLLVGAIIAITLIRFAIKRVTPIRYVIHRIMLSIPIFSNLSVSLNMVNFSRVLALLLKSGVKIVEGLKITSNTSDNLVYRRLIDEAGLEIGKGGQLGAFLQSKKKYFPPLASGMIRVGENTGNLEDNLSYLAEYYEEEIDSKLHNLTSLLEPIMLLIMGLLVGFVALSIITPIYSLSQGFK